jgi:3-hydroxyisobutyrate dehydrogenase-like beta-hydroxyacid dehydrogenase
MANFGYIGLGVMGSRMVDRLMAKGHTVIGHNRTKSKARSASPPFSKCWRGCQE